jgi:rhodanese-related sulfurtransferase
LQLGRTGFEHVRGVLRGLDGWLAEGRVVATFPMIDLDTFVDAVSRADAGPVLDIRSPAEWQAGHLPGSIHAICPTWVRVFPPNRQRTARSGSRCEPVSRLDRRRVARTRRTTAGRVESMRVPDALDRLHQHPLAGVAG